jgi:hypothetical protein
VNTYLKVPVSIANARIDTETIVNERSGYCLALGVYLGWYTAETNAGTSSQQVAICKGKGGVVRSTRVVRENCMVVKCVQLDTSLERNR